MVGRIGSEKMDPTQPDPSRSGLTPPDPPIVLKLRRRPYPTLADPRIDATQEQLYLIFIQASLWTNTFSPQTATKTRHVAPRRLHPRSAVRLTNRTSWKRWSRRLVSPDSFLSTPLSALSSPDSFLSTPLLSGLVAPESEALSSGDGSIVQIDGWDIDGRRGNWSGAFGLESDPRTRSGRAGGQSAIWRSDLYWRLCSSLDRHWFSGEPSETSEISDSLSIDNRSKRFPSFHPEIKYQHSILQSTTWLVIHFSRPMHDLLNQPIGN